MEVAVTPPKSSRIREFAQANPALDPKALPQRSAWRHRRFAIRWAPLGCFNNSGLANWRAGYGSRRDQANP